MYLEKIEEAACYTECETFVNLRSPPQLQLCWCFGVGKDSLARPICAGWVNVRYRLGLTVNVHPQCLLDVGHALDWGITQV